MNWCQVTDSYGSASVCVLRYNSYNKTIPYIKNIEFLELHRGAIIYYGKCNKNVDITFTLREMTDKHNM